MARNQTGGPRGAERATLRGGNGVGGDTPLTALTPSFLGGQGSSSVCSQTYKTTKVFILRCPYRQRLVCDCAKQGDRNQTVEDCKGRCHPRPTSGLHV